MLCNGTEWTSQWAPVHRMNWVAGCWLSICPSVFHCAPSDRKRETRCAWRFSSDGPRPLCNDQCHFPSGRSTLTLDVAPATPDRPIIAVITKLVSSGHDRMRKRP
ncbi:4-hydroxy-3-methylbut-2-enyl diphosphate reductase [Trichinella pseudospiralis]